MVGPWIQAGTLADGELLEEVMRGGLLDAAAYDDKGEAQGTYILEVIWADCAPTGGVNVRGKFLAAEDDYYAWWMLTKRLQEETYHVCALRGDACRKHHQNQDTMHTQSWRSLGQNDIN